MISTLRKGMATFRVRVRVRIRIRVRVSSTLREGFPTFKFPLYLALFSR
jgi:hypothetical protein